MDKTGKLISNVFITPANILDFKSLAKFEGLAIAYNFYRLVYFSQAQLILPDMS